MSEPSDYLWNYGDSYAFMEKVRQGLPPVILVIACNGGVQGKEYNENIPETPDEIADSVYDAYKAGASMVHIHPRDKNKIFSTAGTAEEFYEVNRRVRERCPDIIINNTTGGARLLTEDQMIARLDAKPEFASVNLTPDMEKYKLKERRVPLMHSRPAVEYDGTWAVTYKMVTMLVTEMKKRGIKPELETYHTGGAWVIRDLIEQGLLEEPYWIQTVMGYQTSSFPTVDNVMNLIREFPQRTLWLCSGIGPYELPMTTLATLLGGHVRVGMEDNIYYRRGEKLRSNAQVIERAARIAHELNREIATPVQARKMLGISEIASQYS